MGIEFLGSSRCDPSISIDPHALTPDYEDGSLCAFRVRLTSDLPRMGESLCFTGLVILLKGALRIEASSREGSACVPHDLKEGHFLWNDGSGRFAFAIPQSTESEVLIIAMKSG